MKLATPLFMAALGLFFATAFGSVIINDPANKAATFFIGLAFGCMWVAVKTAFDIGRRN